MTAKLILPIEIDDAALVEAGTDVPEDDYAAWDVATTYDADDRVIKGHIIWRSVVDSNLGNDPETDSGLNWVEELATNRWKVFDGYLQDSASQAETATWQIQASSNVRGVAFLGIDGTEVRVQMEDASAGVVYDETFDLIDESFITDYGLYFFDPASQATDFAITDLPPYPAKITCTVNNPGSTVKLAQLVIGDTIELGATLNEVDIGIDLFSSKEPDDFGRVSAVKRGSADLYEPRIAVDTPRVPYIVNVLKQREALPTVYVFDGPTRDNEFVAFGDFRSMTMTARFGETSELQLEIREYVS